MINIHLKRSTTAWVLLICLTLISASLGWYFAETEAVEQPWLISLVWLTVMIKGQQIVDVFMELSGAPKLWRLLLLSYVIILPAIISLIYWF